MLHFSIPKEKKQVITKNVDFLMCVPISYIKAIKSKKKIKA